MSNFSDFVPGLDDTLADKITADPAGLGNVINASDAAVPNNTDLVCTAESSGDAKKITWTNVKAFLKTYFDTVYQAILVSGTNIKTVNGNTLLGSGDVVISGGVSSVGGTAPIASSGGSTPTISLNVGGVTDTYLAAGIDATKIGTGDVNNTEFAYLDGVTSDIQPQLNSKAASGANTDITSIAVDNTGLNVKDAGNDHTLRLRPTEDYTANRTLSITINNADRLLDLSGGNLTTAAAATVSGTNTGDQFTSTTAERLLGRGAGGGAGAAQEITLGTNLSMSGTTLNASGGGSTNYGQIIPVAMGYGMT